MAYAYTDLETTGLSPWPEHEPWEAALILPGLASRSVPGRALAERCEIVWQLPVDLGRAEPRALQIGRFHDRRWPAARTVGEREKAIAGVDHAGGDPGEGYVVHPDDMRLWAAEYARLTRDDLALVGANVSFDTKDHLGRLLRRHGACPMYHHRPVCTEAALYGYLNGRLAGDKDLQDRYRLMVEASDLPDPLDVPWSHNRLLDLTATLFSVDPRDPDERHTALGDCRLVEGVHQLITGWAA
jgi:hypothetical protein